MKKNNHWYVVIKGWRQGLFDSWKDCSRQIHGYKGAVYKGFPNLEQAYEYAIDNLRGGGRYVIINNYEFKYFKELGSFIEAVEEMLY